MILGLVLPDKNGYLKIWARCGGLFSFDDDELLELAQEYVGKWTNFESRNGVVTSFTIAGKTPGGFPVSMRKGGISMLSVLMIPSAEQMASIGWTSASVFSTVVGRVSLSQEMLDDFWDSPYFDPGIPFEGWVTWHAATENFHLNPQEVGYAQKPARLEELVLHCPWSRKGRLMDDWVDGFPSGRTTHTMFIATKHGDFVLTPTSINLGNKTPDLGNYLRCRIKFFDGESQANKGAVAEYEVLPLPASIEPILRDNYCCYRVPARVTEIGKGYTVFEEPHFGICVDQQRIQYKFAIGQRHVLRIRRPKDLDTYENGWMVEAIETRLPDGEPQASSSRPLSAQNQRQLRPEPNRTPTPEPEKTERMCGFVLNFSHDLMFFGLEDGHESVVHAKFLEKWGIDVEVGDFVECEVGPPKIVRGNLQRQMYACRRRDFDAGFGRMPLKRSGVAQFRVPAYFLQVDDDLNVFSNRYMPKIYDPNRLSLRNRGFNQEYLLNTRFTFAVVCARIPGREENGWIAIESLDREPIERSQAPPPPHDLPNARSNGRPIERDFHRLERPLSGDSRDPRDFRVERPYKQPEYEIGGGAQVSRRPENLSLGNGSVYPRDASAVDAAPELVDTPPPLDEPASFDFPIPAGLPRPEPRPSAMVAPSLSGALPVPGPSTRPLPRDGSMNSFDEYRPSPPESRNRSRVDDLPAWDKYRSTSRKAPPESSSLQADSLSRHSQFTTSHNDSREYAGPEIPVPGLCIKSWGTYRIIWLKDGRLALHDTKKKALELGVFIDGFIEKLEKPLCGKKMTYEWQVNGFLPTEKAYDIAPQVEGQAAMFLIRKALVAAYRPYERTRVVVLEDADGFFGEFWDKNDVLEDEDLAPQDEIAVVIKAAPNSETTIEWIVHSKVAEKEQELEVPRDDRSGSTFDNLSLLSSPTSELNRGDTPNSNDPRDEAEQYASYREVVQALLKNKDTKNAIARRQPAALQKAARLLDVKKF
ncbi:unnamed protein product, partial [Mesorhabditis spiculigera]